MPVIPLICLLNSAFAGPLPAKAISLPAEDLASAALVDWAGDAPIVVRVTAVAIDVHRRPMRSLTSDVVLRVDEILRADDQQLSEGDLVEMTLPGGELETWGQLTSEAPVFVEGDEGIVILEERDGGLWPAHGNRSFLPLDDDMLSFCAAPSEEALHDCMLDDELVLPVEGVVPADVETTRQHLSATDLSSVGL